MSYDGSIQEELAGYFEEKEPGRRERADAWAMASGRLRRVGPDKGGHWEVCSSTD